MGKLKAFSISLDASNAVYTAGSTLQGLVSLELSEPMKMRGIRLRFYGGANVHWSERHTTGSGKNRRTVTRHYRSNETYFDYTLTLYGKAPNESGDNPEHPAGQFTYPFHYILPQNLPSSFEGAHGRVRYWIKCNIDKPWKFDHNCKAAYTVLSILDLNQQPTSLNPQTGSNSKTLCCLCCESGPISAQFHIDRTGYVPGEFIQLSGEVSNKSNRTMSNSRVEFKMTTIFHATTKSKRLHQLVGSLRKEEIEAGQSAIWSGETMHIPPLPPSDLIHCRIIDIKYTIVLVVDPSGPAFDLEVPLEICIGTVPLQNVYASFANAPPAYFDVPQNMYDDSGVITAQPAIPSAPPPAQSSQEPPPPSYAECVLGKVDIHEDEDSEFTHGNMNFAPIYTYYGWNQNQTQPSAPMVAPPPPGPTTVQL